MSEAKLLEVGTTRLGGQVRPFVASHFITYLGDGLFYICAALYFTRFVGLAPVTYGAALTGSWLVAVVLSVPVGHLADRFEARTVSIAMMAISGFAVAAFLVTSSLPTFVAAACVFVTCTQGTQSARSALIARTFPAGQVTRVRALLVTSANAGLALGALLGAAVIVADTATSYRLAFGADALTFLLAAALLRLVPATGRRSTARDRSADGSGKTRAGRIHGVFADRGFVAVGVANMLLCLYIPLIDVAIPLWVVNRTHAPKWIIPGVFIVNSLLVVALQYRVAKDIHGVDHGVRSLRWAGGLLFAGMILYASSGMGESPWQAAVLLLTASAVVTLGDVRHNASMTEISFRLTPGGRYGQYQGFFGMGTTVAEAVGPLVVTWLVLSRGVWGWFALGVVFLVTSFAVRVCVDLARRAPILRENA